MVLRQQPLDFCPVGRGLMILAEYVFKLLVCFQCWEVHSLSLGKNIVGARHTDMVILVLPQRIAGSGYWEIWY